MSSASGVTAATLRGGLLAGLLGPGRPLASVTDAELDSRILLAEGEIARELSTRWTVTEFTGAMGPGALSSLSSGQEWEGPYDWPGKKPGDGFPTFNLKVRPLDELLGATIVYPGGTQHPITVPVDWWRADHFAGKLLMAPNFFAAPFAASGLPTAIIGLTGGRLPMAVLFHYKAGLTDAIKAEFPQLARMVELKAMSLMLLQLSLLRNPDQFTSVSADGLSQSRSNGFIYKDLDDRLKAEYEDTKESLFHLWDGPSFLVV